MTAQSEKNPLGLKGLDFIEFSGPDAHFFDQALKQLSLREIGQVHGKNIRAYRQGEVTFLVNCEPQTLAMDFARVHGPSVCALGFFVESAEEAYQKALSRGARAYEGNEHQKASTLFPAIYGVGDSLIFFLDEKNQNTLYKESLLVRDEEAHPTGNILSVDHLTNNVPQGELQKWYDFYAKILGFQDISNSKTSVAMQAPSENFVIEIHEPSAANIEVLEYLKEFKGSGIQHIALAAQDAADPVTCGPVQIDIIKKGAKRWSK